MIGKIDAGYLNSIFRMINLNNSPSTLRELLAEAALEESKAAPSGLITLRVC